MQKVMIFHLVCIVCRRMRWCHCTSRNVWYIHSGWNRMAVAPFMVSTDQEKRQILWFHLSRKNRVFCPLFVVSQFWRWFRYTWQKSRIILITWYEITCVPHRHGGRNEKMTFPISPSKPISRIIPKTTSSWGDFADIAKQNVEQPSSKIKNSPQRLTVHGVTNDWWWLPNKGPIEDEYRFKKKACAPASGLCGGNSCKESGGNEESVGKTKMEHKDSI